MNSRQAINLLKDLEQCLDDYCELNDEGKTAFGMAITALELFGNTERLPSAQPENTRILAEALNGSPLLYPCDKLWSREGWCKDHCKKGQTEPDTECWLKYAETIAAERREE